jgi:hypothetical protein
MPVIVMSRKIASFKMVDYHGELKLSSLHHSMMNVYGEPLFYMLNHISRPNACHRIDLTFMFFKSAMNTQLHLNVGQIYNVKQMFVYQVHL